MKPIKCRLTSDGTLIAWQGDMRVVMYPAGGSQLEWCVSNSKRNEWYVADGQDEKDHEPLYQELVAFALNWLRGASDAFDNHRVAGKYDPMREERAAEELGTDAAFHEAEQAWHEASTN